MNKITFSIIILLFFIPSTGLANTDLCNFSEISIIYINGILTSEENAKKSLTKIELTFAEYSDKYKSLNFYKGYNPTRGALIDLPKTALQTYEHD